MAITAGTMLKRGLRKRCAVCGQGRLFRRWTRMLPECPRCGYRFHRKPGQWLGSWFLNVCLVQLVLVLVVIVVAGVTWPTTSAVLLTSVTLGAAIVVPVAFFPFSRTIWIAIDLAMKPLDFDDDVPPGFELERELADLLAEETRRRGPDSEPPTPPATPD